MKKTFILIFLFFIFSFFFLNVSSASAVDHYVRSDANGTNNGNDWANAYTSLPNTLTRGDIYYIADGVYGSYIFDDAVNGTKYIYIKKAIQSEHGTDVGWQSGYGDGQAVFSVVAPSSGSTSVWRITSDNYDFDGKTGIGKQDRGIRLEITGSGAGSGFHVMVGSSVRGVYNLIFKHIEFAGRGVQYGCGDRGFYIDSNAKYLCGDYTFSYCYFHDTSSVMIHTIGAGYIGAPNTGEVPLNNFTNRVSNIVVDHSYFAREKSTPECHGEAVQGAGNNAVFSNNVFENIEGTGVVTLGFAKNLKFYGNIFFHTPSYPNPGQYGGGLSFVVGCAGNQYCDNVSFYNNVMYNVAGINNGISHGIDGQIKDSSTMGLTVGKTPESFLVYNNIWYNCPKINFMYAIHDYNTFINSILIGGAVINSSENSYTTKSLFANLSNEDFHLTSPTDSGLSLGSPFNVDPDGNIRGLDGNVDRGAYEYTGNLPSDIIPPSNPTGLSVR